MMISITVIAVMFFIIGIFTREMFKTVIEEIEAITEGIEKACDSAKSKA